MEEKDLYFNSKSSSKSFNLENFLKFVGLIVLFIVAIGLLLVSKDGEFTFRDLLTILKNKVINTSSTANFIQFDLETFPVVVAYSSKLVSVNNKGIKVYNEKGEEEWGDSRITLTSPLVEACGNYMVVVDKKGGNIYVFRGKTQKWYAIVQGEILDVSINEKGYVGIIYKDNNYKTIVKIFDNKGSEVLVRYYANNYALDVKISPDNRFVAVGEIDVSDVKTSSGVRFIPFDSKEDTIWMEEDSVISAMEFIGKDLIVAFDKKLVSFGPNGSKKLLYNFRKEKVVNINIDKSGFIVKIQKNFGFVDFSNKIEIINEHGKIVGNFGIKDNIINVDTNKNVIAINLGSKVIFINSSGKEIGQFSPKKDVREIKLFRNGLYAGIIYIDGIDIVNVK